MSEALRQWLATELDRRGWSHREFARQMGASHSFISKILAGKVPASVNFCHKAAAVLGVSPETVLRLAGVLPPGPPALPDDDNTLIELLELARILSPETRQQLLDYARFLAGQPR